MIIPQHWAEGRAQSRIGGKSRTIRRFGWSDVSQADAQAMADRRAAEALQRLEAGERLPRSEPKVPYNGADGCPIREEITSRHGDAIVTRNSYGARCLNTPNVLFADIDFPRPGDSIGAILTVLGLVAVVTGGALGWRLGSGIVALASVLIGLIATIWIASWLHPKWVRRQQRRAIDPEPGAMARIADFAASHPDWHLRVYRTPAGLRVLAMHAVFKSDDAAVAEFFRRLDVDPTYRYMCLHQKCFRARVSPKPWRIGIPDHLRPRPGVWPVAPERRPQRDAWIARYEALAQDFAACRFRHSLGSDAVHPDARHVQELHDAMCRATTDLPIA